MSDQKLSDLTAESTIAPDDLVMAVDVSDTTMAATGTNKKVLRESLQTYNAGTLTTGKTVLDLSATWDRAQISVTGASGTGTTATLTFADQTTAPYAIGATIVVASVNPTGYNGTFVVTGCTSTSVSYASTVTTTYVSGGNINLLFTGMKFNATDTASASTSLLADFQVGGSSKLKIDKQGNIIFAPTGVQNILSTSQTTLQANAGNMVLNGQVLANSVGATLVSGGAINWSSSTNIYGAIDLSLFRDAADTLAQRRTTNPQTFRIYNSFTDGSNFERGKLQWDSNVLKIGTEKAGTGSARALELQTDGTTRLTIGTNGLATFANNVIFSGNIDNINNTGSIKAGSVSQGAALVINFPTSGSLGFARESASTGNIIIGTASSGGGGQAVNTIEFGDKAWTTTPSGFTATSPSGAGTNISGGNFTILGGVSTGTGVGGSICFNVTPAGSSGTTRNAAVNVMQISAGGLVQFGGTTSSFPALKRDSTTLKVRLADDSADAPFSAAAGTFSGVVTAPNLANGRSMGRFTPLDNQPPAANFATLDTRNSIAVLDFDAGTDEAAVFVGVIPQAATLTSGIKVRIFWMATSAESGDCVWGAQFEKFGTDYDSDSFDTATTVTTTASGTSGIAVVSEITCTTIDSLAAGDMFRIKIYRDADAGGDTMTGDAELVAVELQQVA